MNASIEPLPDGEDPLALAEFRFRLEHDPDFGPRLQRHYEAALALPPGPDTGDMQSQARAALKTLKHYQGKLLSVQALEKCKAETLEAMHEGFDETVRRRLLDLAAEAADHILDVREPERTELMAKATEIQDLLRNLRLNS